MWILFSLGSAFFESFADLFGKRGAMKVNEYAVVFSQRFFSLAVLVPLLFIMGVPRLDGIFWLTLFINVPLITLGLVFYMKALRVAPMSLVVPIIALAPAFLLITSPIMLKEIPGAWGVFGILLTAIGAYVLNLGQSKKDFFAPFKNLVRERGPRYMLFAAIIFSVTSNLDKIAILHSSPIAYLTIGNGLLAFCGLFLIVFNGVGVRPIFGNIFYFFPIGIFSAITLSFQMTALSLAFVPYIFGLKRFSSLFSIVLGKVFFHEDHMKERMAGAILMIAGGMVIMLFS